MISKIKILSKKQTTSGTGTPLILIGIYVYKWSLKLFLRQVTGGCAAHLRGLSWYARFSSFFTWPVFGGPWEFWKPVLLHTKSEVWSNVTWMPKWTWSNIQQQNLIFSTNSLLACQLLQARMYTKHQNQKIKLRQSLVVSRILQQNHRFGFLSAQNSNLWVRLETHRLVPLLLIPLGP